MTFKFGLEQEFFVRRREGLDIIEIPEKSSLPFDACGYLAEARGKPANNIIEAVFNLRAEVYRINKLAESEGLALYRIDSHTISQKMRDRIHRRFAKGTVSYQNLYGYEHHKNKKNEGTAGIHLSVTNELSIQRNANGNYYTETVNLMWDFFSFFRYMDKYFNFQIKNSRRNPGFYELKSNGRIEYRSLPTTTNYDDIIKAVEKYRF